MLKSINMRWLHDMLLFFRRNRLLLLLVFSLFSGVLIGSIIIGESTTVASLDLSVHVAHHFAQRSQNGILVSALRSFGSAVVYLFLVYLSGMSVWGSIALVLLPACKGLGIGVVCGYLYLSQGLHGLALSLLVVIPISFANSLLLVVACRYSLPFSTKLAAYCFSYSFAEQETISLRIYHLRFLLLLLMEVFVSLADGLLSATFLNIFSLADKL